MKLPIRMSELGIDSTNFEVMAKKCTGNGEGTIGGLEKLTWQDVVEIFKLAL